MRGDHPGRDAEHRAGEEGERAAAGGERDARRGLVRRARRRGEVVDAAGPGDDLGVVGGRDDRSPGGAVGGDEADDGGPRVPVLPHRRLVGEEHRRAVVERRGDGEAALLTAGEVARVGRGERREPERVEEGEGPGLFLGALTAEGAGGREHLVEHGAGDERRARPLRHPGEAGGEGGRVEAPGVGGVLVGAQADGVVGDGVEEAGERGEDRRLARPARADEDGEVAGGRRQRLVELRGPHGAGRAVDETHRAVDGERVGREGGAGGRGDGGEQPGVDGEGGGRGLVGDPEAHREQHVTLRGQHLLDGAVGDDAAVGGEHDEPVDEGDPRAEDVLDDDERAGVVGRQRGDGGPHLGGAGGVEHRRRLVEEDEGGVEGERAGEGEPLGLPARQRRGGGVEGQVGQADGRQRALDDGGHPGRVGADVLEAERDVAPDARGDDAAAGLLEDEPDGAGAVARGGPVEGDVTLEVARLEGAEHPREGAQEGGLARPRRPGEQDPLAGAQGERHVAQHGLAPADGSPGEPGDLDVAAPRGAHGVRQPGPPGPPGRPGTPRAPPPGPAAG